MPDILPFAVVQYTKSKNSKPRVTVSPSSWVNGNVYSYPPSNYNTLSCDSTTVPGKNWLKIACKVRSYAKTWEEGDDLIEKFVDVTDSDDKLDQTRSTVMFSIRIAFSV